MRLFRASLTFIYVTISSTQVVSHGVLSWHVSKERGLTIVAFRLLTEPGEKRFARENIGKRILQEILSKAIPFTLDRNNC